MIEIDEIKSASMESSLQLQTSWMHETRIREWRNVCFELTGSRRRHCISAKDFYDILAELSKNQRSRNCSEVAGLDVVAVIIASFCSNAPIGGLRNNLSDQWFYRAMEILLQMVMLKNTSNHLQQEPLPSSLTTCRFLENESRSILQIIYREDVLSNESFAYPFDLWLKIAYPGNDFLKNVGKNLPMMFTSGCLHLAGYTKEVLHLLALSKAKPENIGLFSANRHKYFSCPSTSSSGEVKTLETYHSRGRETHFTFPRKMRKWHPLAILASGDTSTPMSTTNINDSEPLEFLPLFHKALKKNVEYLISISARLAENVGRLEEFRQVFNILQQRHRLYGDAKGQFIIPALEAKTKLLNVSWSYTFDHELEVKYLDKVSAFLDEIFKFQNLGYITGQKRMNVARLCCELCHTCQSFHELLSDHISTEGNELWPFFSQCFSVKEQEKIIANILGRTSAKTIQSIIPWLTSCLPREDQQVMMSLWRKIAKNTMFDDWLEEWWFGYGTDGAEVSSSSAVLRYLSGEVLEEQCDPMSDKGISCSREECLVDNIELLEKCGLAVKDQDSAEEKAKHCEVADMTDRVDLSEQTKSKFVPRRNRCKRHLTMNQDHPETAMRRVSCDPATDSESTKNKESSQKLFRQQNLHTEAANSPDSNNIPGQHPSYRDPLEQTFGCRHYKRSCKLVTSCCNQLYTCIRCHDEESDHSTKRRAISEMMCMKCLVIQPIAQKCSSDSCNNFSMGRYYCSVCKLFDDEREIYHCPYCNLCRVGKGLGIKYFHCMNCNACMSESLSVHICREKCFENNCPICHEYIFTSSEPVKSLPCGHLMHSTCFKEYTCSRYTCPICSKSLGDMQVYFQKLDDELAAEEIPEECSGKHQAILCNDCEKKGSAAFHWVHHKCSYCGSYNTRLI